jgi:hypothetical protein
MSSAKFESVTERDTHTAGFAERVRANQKNSRLNSSRTMTS